MPRSTGIHLAVAISVVLCLTPRPAPAYGGFLVSTGDVEPRSVSSTAVLMRDGERTVLSLQLEVEAGSGSLALVVPVFRLLFGRWLPEVMGVVVLSAVLAHTGWHWMLARGGALMQYTFTAPAGQQVVVTLDSTSAAASLNWPNGVWLDAGTPDRDIHR